MRTHIPAYQIYAASQERYPPPSGKKGFAATQNVFYTNSSVDCTGPSIFKPPSSVAYDDEQREATLFTSRQRGTKEASLYAMTEEEAFENAG